MARRLCLIAAVGSLVLRRRATHAQPSRADGAQTAHAASPQRHVIPLGLKLAYTIFLGVLVPVYARTYGVANFLWFSDIALLTTGVALWLESRWLTSLMSVGVLLPELFWNLSFFSRLATGIRISGLTDYMFDASTSRFLRGLSLFHVAVPLLLVWMLRRLGYDPRALAGETAVAWVVLPITYLTTDPKENVNWVYGPGSAPQHRIPPLVYLALEMLVFPLFVHLPTHAVLMPVFWSGDPLKRGARVHHFAAGRHASLAGASA